MADEMRLAVRRPERVLGVKETLNRLPTELLLMILEQLLRIDPVTLLGSVPGVNRRIRALTHRVHGDWPEEPLTEWARQSEDWIVEGALRSAVTHFPRTTGLSAFGDYRLHRMSAAGIVPTVKRQIGELLNWDNINKGDDRGRTPLFIACEEGYFEVAHFLLQNGAKFNEADYIGRTPLYIACNKGYLDIVRLLVEKGADTNKAMYDGATPLWAACWGGHPRVVRFLVQNGAKFHNNNREILIACHKGHLGVVQVILESGVGVNTTTATGWTPLLEACERGHEKVVRLLVEAGADVNQADEKGTTPLAIAHEYGYFKIVRLLVEKGAE